MLFFLLQHLSPCAMNVTTAATGSTNTAQSLLHPQDTSIPSASTQPSSWNQILHVAQQIASRWPPTSAQSSGLYVLFSSYSSSSLPFVEWKLGVKMCRCFPRTHGGPHHQSMDETQQCCSNCEG